MKKLDNFNIDEHVVSNDVSYRGGTLKVDVSSLFPKLETVGGPIMGAYQNYLGGGIAGAICGGANFMPDELSKKDQEVFHALMERIKMYFHSVCNGGGDEYMQENYGSYEFNQGMPVSAY